MLGQHLTAGRELLCHGQAALCAQPPYRDVRPFAEALIAANPDHLLWGSDWPHPSIPVAVPNDGDLVDMMMDWAADEALRLKLFVANAEKLYGFEPVTG